MNDKLVAETKIHGEQFKQFLKIVYDCLKFKKISHIDELYTQRNLIYYNILLSFLLSITCFILFATHRINAFRYWYVLFPFRVISTTCRVVFLFSIAAAISFIYTHSNRYKHFHLVNFTFIYFLLIWNLAEGCFYRNILLAKNFTLSGVLDSIKMNSKLFMVWGLTLLISCLYLMKNVRTR